MYILAYLFYILNQRLLDPNVLYAYTHRPDQSVQT